MNEQPTWPPLRIPLAAGKKFPATSEPWRELAKADEADLWKAAGRSPDGNAGWRCDDIVVIDTDTPEADEHWRTHGPPTPFRVRTRKGTHHYYRVSANLEIPPGRFEGGDIKTGQGAYVVAPGSEVDYVEAGETCVHEYVWEDESPSSWNDLPPISLDDLSMLPGHVARRSQRIGVALDGVDVVGAGSRNNFLTSIGGSLRYNGLSKAGIDETLLAINRAVCSPALDEREVLQIAASLSRYEAGAVPTAITLIEGENTVVVSIWDLEDPQPPSWLWEPYVPEGRLVLLDGSEGIGKGLFCARLAHYMASGEWPDGGTESGNVLWMTAEDDPRDDVKRRLIVLGLDRNEDEDLLFLNRPVTFPNDVLFLEEQIRERDIRLVVMDPGRAYLGGSAGVSNKSFNDEAFVRPGMQALNSVAQRTGATIIFVHHWNKDRSGSIAQRQAGSAAFAQVVRHRLTLTRSDCGLAAFAVQKSNIGSTGHVRQYVVEPIEDTARFVLGPRLDYDSLDSWERDAQQTGVELLPGSILEDWCEKHLTAGMTIPSEALLREALNLSVKEVKGARQYLIDRRLAVQPQPHRPLVWTGRQEPDAEAA